MIDCLQDLKLAGAVVKPQVLSDCASLYSNLVAETDIQTMPLDSYSCGLNTESGLPAYGASSITRSGQVGHCPGQHLKKGTQMAITAGANRTATASGTKLLFMVLYIVLSLRS